MQHQGLPFQRRTTTKRKPGPEDISGPELAGTRRSVGTRTSVGKHFSGERDA